MVSLSDSSMIRAKVTHARRLPVMNRFSYGIDYLLLNENLLLKSKTGLKLFSFNKPNLVSLYPSDHGVAGCDDFAGVRQLVRDGGIDDGDQILLLTHPRYWGYTFNPVSFFLIYNQDEKLRAVVAEVHNTFGDRHAYLCTAKDGKDIGGQDTTVSVKQFHVSPFFDISGSYRFRFRIDESRVAIHIHYDDGQGGGLSTSISGARTPLTDRALASALLRRPLGAARTTALIHWQALRLWRKGVRYRPRPEPPSEAVTK